MEKRTVTVVRPGDKRKAIFGAGDEYYYFATGKETDGHYFFFEGIVPPGGGPPPHIQTREEEAFYILEGEVVFHADGEKVVATAGTFLNIPKGVVHNFRNESDAAARMLIFFAPSGIEDMFEEAAAVDPNAMDMEMLSAIGEKYGVEFVKPS